MSTCSLIFIMLALFSISAHGEQVVSKQLLKQDVQCTDQCITSCYDNGSSDCFTHCECKSERIPSVTDLYEQNECYSTCGNKCLLLEEAADRSSCFAECPCQCNKFCYDQCHAAGLNAVCDQTCGCSGHQDLETDHNEDDEHQEDEHEDALDEAADKEDDEHILEEAKDKTDDAIHIAAKDSEYQEIAMADSSFLDFMAVGESISAFDLEPDTGFTVVKNGTSQGPTEFINALALSEDDDEARCDPDCWRGCLQMSASKDQVFTCIKECGCAYESPNLLLLGSSSMDNLGKDSVSIAFTMTLILLFGFICCVAFYVYKSEYDNKLQEAYIEMEGEEGYERLD